MLRVLSQFRLPPHPLPPCKPSPTYSVAGSALKPRGDWRGFRSRPFSTTQNLGAHTKAYKFGLSLLIGAVALTSALYAGQQESAPAVLASLEGKAWVERSIQQHPEILWLADEGVRKTEEGKATGQGSYSEQLFGKKYVEFDRTIMTLQCLKWIIQGDEPSYQAFTAAQPKEARLSCESFQTLHLQAKRLLESGWGGLSPVQMAEAMETALVLGDMGKSEKARELFKKHHVLAPDHDDFYGDAMHYVIPKNPHLCPSFARLAPAARTLIATVANLAHYGHITHLEGGSGMFYHLKRTGLPSEDPVALAFDLFVHTCDVAGALGHVNNQSSVVYTEPTHKAMQAMGRAVGVLCDASKTEKEAHDAYLQARASWLGLNTEIRSDRVLTRMGAMLRLFKPEEGGLLRQAMESLDPKMREKIIAQFDDQASDPLLLRTPTYMPAVLVNLSNNEKLGKTAQERLIKAITIGLPFLTAVLERHKELVASGAIRSDIPLCFNKAAGTAKTNPDLLSQGNFKIDAEGNVVVQ